MAALLTLFAQGVGGVSLLIRNSSLAYACKRRSSTTSDDFPDGDDIRREAFQRDVSNESAFVSADEWSRKDFVEGQSHQISSDFVKEEKGRKRDFFIFIVVSSEDFVQKKIINIFPTKKHLLIYQNLTFVSPTFSR